jgi:hypothetical protein
MKPANYAPVYAAALYPGLAEITRKHGYALAVHGSLARDMDLICVPWTIEASEPQVVVNAITKRYAIEQLKDDPWSYKEHGRIVTVLTVGFGECFIDLSFMPRLYD